MARSPDVLLSEITAPLAGLIALVVLRLKGRRDGTDTWRFRPPSTNVSLVDHIQISHPIWSASSAAAKGLKLP